MIKKRYRDFNSYIYTYIIRNSKKVENQKSSLILVCSTRIVSVLGITLSCMNKKSNFGSFENVHWKRVNFVDIVTYAPVRK